MSDCQVQGNDKIELEREWIEIWMELNMVYMFFLPYNDKITFKIVMVVTYIIHFVVYFFYFSIANLIVINFHGHFMIILSFCITLYP